MKLQRIILPSMLLTGALAVGAIGVNIVSAQENGQRYPSIVQRLSTRFGLNEDEVQDVFDEVHAERHAEMKTRLEERLSESVTEGTITEEQKQAILEKHDEMQDKMETLKESDLTHEERHQEVKAFHEEMKTWAKEQGLDMKDLMFIGKGFGKGMRGRHMMGAEPVRVELN